MKLTKEQKLFLINLLQTVDPEDVDFKTAMDILAKLQD